MYTALECRAMLHASETWPLTKTNLQHLQCNDRMIRQICSIKQKDVATVRSMELLAKLELSALDKILGQLGIYATWLSLIAYLQKQLRIFIFFMPQPLFFCDLKFSYCMKPSGKCLHIYSLPSSAFLKYQTSGLYCTWSKSHPLVYIRAYVYTLQSFTFIIVFFCKILEWAPIFYS